MKGVYCIRTIVEGVPDMADDFSTDNMLDYIGNGKIVHASGVKTVIKIGYATYREILSVRRIV